MRGRIHVIEGRIGVMFEVSAQLQGFADSAAHRPLRLQAQRDALREILTLLDVDELL
jgi:hypothetical protein